jgi:hypothetical protein
VVNVIQPVETKLFISTSGLDTVSPSSSLGRRVTTPSQRSYPTLKFVLLMRSAINTKMLSLIRKLMLPSISCLLQIFSGQLLGSLERDLETVKPLEMKFCISCTEETSLRELVTSMSNGIKSSITTLRQRMFLFVKLSSLT